MNEKKAAAESWILVMFLHVKVEETIFAVCYFLLPRGSFSMRCFFI
jgi:hypothetical protein